MNPDEILDLKAALKRLARVRVNARKEKVTLTPEDEEEFLRGVTGGKFGRADIGNMAGNYPLSAGQGAAMNWLDEAVGLFSPEAKENLRIRGETFREEHPIADAALGVAGGLAVPGFGAARIAGRGVVGLGREVLRGASLGAGAGAIAGAGASENMEDIPRDALVGGAAGGVLGGALSGAVGGVRHFFSPSLKAAKLRENLVEQAGGADRIRRETAALARVEPGVTAAEATPGLLGTVKNLISKVPGLYEETSQRAIEREAGSNARLAVPLARGVQAPALQERALRQSRQAWAASDAGFEGLRRQYDQLPDPAPFVRYFTQPEVQRLWARAELQGLIGQQIPMAAPHTGSLSFAQAHEVVQALANVVNKRFQQPAQQQLARQLRSVHTAVREELERQVPEYAPRAAEYAERIALENGVKLGSKMFRASANNMQEIASQIGELPQSAQQQARDALRAELARKFASGNTGRSAGLAVVKDPAMQEKIRMAFADPDDFDAFMELARTSARLARFKGVAAGSESAVRTAGRGGDASLGEAAGESAISGSVLAASTRIPRAVGRAAVKNSESAAGERVLRELLAPGMSGVDDFLRAASTRTPRVGGRAAAAAPAASSVMAQRIQELFQRQ